MRGYKSNINKRVKKFLFIFTMINNSIISCNGNNLQFKNSACHITICLILWILLVHYVILSWFHLDTVRFSEFTDTYVLCSLMDEFPNWVNRWNLSYTQPFFFFLPPRTDSHWSAVQRTLSEVFPVFSMMSHLVT